MARTILGGYKTYSFKDHDPILDKLDRVIELGGNPTRQTIADKSGLTVGTLHRWHHRAVKKPQFASVVAAIKAIGGNVVVVYDGKTIRGS